MTDERRRATLEEAERKAQEIGRLIGSQTPPGWGFLLCMASFGDGGSSTYVSDIHRETTPTFLRELATRLETGEGSLNVKHEIDPILSEALTLLNMIASMLALETVSIQVAVERGAIGRANQAQAEADKFMEAFSSLLAAAKQMIERYAPQLLEEGNDGV